MSRERELLVNALERLNYINYEDDHLTNDLIQTIEKFLAKRDQPESTQEPEAWILEDKKTGYRRQSAYKPTVLDKEAYKVIPLYTAPPKREPLSDGEITTNTPKTIPIGERLAFHAGIRWAEHQHGITGGGE